MTHSIVEAAERTFMGFDRGDIYSQDGEPIAVDERMHEVILTTLRHVRKTDLIGRLTPRTAAPNVECPAALALIQGYIDAVIREIEA